MTTTYNPSSAGPLVLAYQQVSDGDKRKAASINPGISAAEDDIARIANGAKVVGTLPRTYNHFEYFPVATDPVYWTKNALQWTQFATATGVAQSLWLNMPIDLPHGAELVTIQVWILPFAGVHGALPALMPEISLDKVDLITGVATNIGSQFDSSGSVGAYESTHGIQLTGLTEVIDRTRKTYTVRLVGEGSTNSHTGLIALGAIAYCTSGFIDQGAG